MPRARWASRGISRAEAHRVPGPFFAKGAFGLPADRRPAHPRARGVGGRKSGAYGPMTVSQLTRRSTFLKVVPVRSQVEAGPVAVIS